jgi:hypothetical protein
MPDSTVPGIPYTTANGTEATPVPSPRPLSHSGAVQGGWFQRLQAFEDAVAYRRARAGAPCPDCGPAASGRRCDDHGRDLDLIDEYLRTIHLTTEYLRALHRGIPAGGLPSV